MKRVYRSKTLSFEKYQEVRYYLTPIMRSRSPLLNYSLYTSLAFAKAMISRC